MYIALLFFPFIGFLFTSLLSRFVSKFYIIRLNLLSLIAAIVLATTLLNETLIGGLSVTTKLNDWIAVGYLSVFWNFVFDQLSMIMLLLVLLISTLVHFYSWEYMGNDPHFIRFLSFLSIFSFFMLLFVVSSNYLLMFAGWEGVGLSSYLLINFWYTRLAANKAAMKAIIVNRISDCALYVGLFILYFLFHNLSYYTVFGINNNLFLDILWLTSITFLIFVGAVGKSAQLGLHTWLPDAMEGPTPVSALLHAATMVTAGVYLLLRSSHLLIHTPLTLCLIALIGGLTTAFAGSVGRFQSDIKRIIAFSTCAQLGYMFLILGLSQFNVAFFHLFNHAFFKALLFLGAGSVIHAVVDEQDIRKMGALFNFLPITYVSFFIASLALAGIPYLTGFYSKDLLLELTFFSFNITSLFIYWAALSSAFFTAFYSVRVLYYTFCSTANGNTIKAVESGNTILSVLIILTIFSVLVGFLAKDLFVGVVSNLWSNSLNIPVLYNQFFETELGFIFAGNYAANKLFPLFLTLLSLAVAIIVILNWVKIIKIKSFRVIFAFINQKWFFDIIYNNIVKKIMSFSYYITFKLVDRGLLEYSGGLFLNMHLFYITKYQLTLLESSNMYNYLFFPVILLGSVLFILIIL